MQKLSVLYRAAAFLLLAAAAPRLLRAVDTHVWEQADQGDFSRGTSKHLSIRVDGHLTLAPQFKELDSTGVPYLWTVAQNSKGVLYYAGGAPTGATAKVFALAPNGKPKLFAELTGLEVHALAIDSQDRVYAAVLPDSKIYRIDSSGKPQIFFDPKAKYVWSMAFDRAGNLFVATGDAGIIYRVTPDGRGAKFFDTEETHVRSMVVDDAGNLIVGTEPGGLILRITSKGEGFVLYQANKREVTAVAEHNGVIFAAAVGSKTSSPSVTGPAPVLPTAPPPISGAGTPRAGSAPPSLPPATGSISATVNGGSEFYRIQQDGFAERLWNSATDLVYAIAFDASGKPLLGTGNKGVIYRIDSDQISTQLLDAPPTQVTAFLKGRGGIIYAATGNVGNLYEIGPGIAAEGTLESDVLDANDFAYWGKVHIASNLHGGAIQFEARSGNLNNPQNDWSPWSKVTLNPLGGQVQSPPARFLQYRLTLTGASSGASPEVNTIDVAYLPKNIAPKIGPIEIAPFNYREAPSNNSLERSVAASGSPATLSLPAVGLRRSSSLPANLEPGGSATVQYNKGFVTVRWNASDPNSDSLTFKVEIRGKNESFWRTLKDHLLDRYYAFDSATFPDGEYVVRVTASDSPANIPANALSSSLESDPFIIDNTPPEIIDVSTSKAESHRAIKFTAKDALSWIDKAEYSINGGEWISLTPDNSVTDSQTLGYTITADAGQLIAVRVFDEDDNVVVRQFSPQ